MLSSVSTFTDNYTEKLSNAAALIQQANKLIIGIGDGLSAAAGLDYSDPALFNSWYQHYFDIGFRSIADIQQYYWFSQKRRAECSWGFWAQHIWHICYEARTLQPYLDLFDIVKDKDFFIITTRADSQIEKAGFSEENILSPQGNYAYFQCSAPCSSALYDNKAMVEAMIKNMPTRYEIRTEDIPLCPNCGAPLIPNLPLDEHFVETQRIQRRADYKDFIRDNADQHIVFLELGVDPKTPILIRNPFEVMTNEMHHASLIRINSTFADVPRSIKDKTVCLQEELSKVMNDLKESLT